MLGFTLSVALAACAAAATPAPGPAAPGGMPAPTQVRATIERGLPFLEKQGLAWLDTRKCIACHHGAWMVWGFNEARRAGIAVDDKKLDDLTSRVVRMYLADRPEHEKKKTGWVESTYMLLSQYDRPGAGDKAAEWRGVTASLIVAGQRPDGTWKYAGQGLDLPAAEADEATTLWTALALPDGAKGGKASRDRALAWLKKAKPGPGHDSAALRLAVAQRFGDPAPARTLKDQLLARQNPDGGWNWSKKKAASDAFATGESLYALSLAGVQGDAPAVRNAWKFLVTTQQPDGSWRSSTRKPNGGSEISTYWASAWAVIGLSRSLPQPAE
jgi:Squalene-hopene cyclase N-terminal domain